jgi:hypothetical protein
VRAIMLSMKPYSEDLRARIVKAVEEGMSKSGAARLFDVSLSPLYGWAPRGQRAHCSAPRNRGPNTTLLSSMTLEGMGPSLAVKGATGERIALASNVGMDNAEIFVMNSDGSERTRLTDIPGHDHWPPTWFPDSTRIAFTSEGTGEIYVMNSDGSGLTKLTDDSADDALPAWRPRVK